MRRVEPILPDLQFNPNVPNARLILGDDGSALLRIAPHPDDPDRSDVELRWWDVMATTYSARFNDEAIHGHPLWEHGLSSVMWVGVIATERSNESHFLVPTKEALFEVWASAITAGRSLRSTNPVIERPEFPQPRLGPDYGPATEWENWALLDALQASQGLIGPSVRGLAVEVQSERVVLHACVAQDRSEDRANLNELVVDLQDNFDEYYDREIDVQLCLYVGETDGAWPGHRFRRLYLAQAED